MNNYSWNSISYISLHTKLWTIKVVVTKEAVECGIVDNDGRQPRPLSVDEI